MNTKMTAVELAALDDETFDRNILTAVLSAYSLLRSDRSRETLKTPGFYAFLARLDDSGILRLLPSACAYCGGPTGTSPCGDCRLRLRFIPEEGLR